MHLCLFEDARVSGLRPLTETRPAYDLRVGIRTLLETAVDVFAPSGTILHTRPLVAPIAQQAHPNARVNHLPDAADVLFINGRLIADDGPAVAEIHAHINGSTEARAFTHEDALVAAWVPGAATRLPSNLLSAPTLPPDPFSDMPATALDTATLVTRPWHLLDALDAALRRDAAARSAESPPSAPIHDRPHTTVHDSAVAVAPDRIQLGAGASVRPGAVLNAEEGPIVIDGDATVSEHAVLKGPCYVGPKSQINAGADIEGTAFGYWCKVGGEVHDTIIHSLSNKAHPGFLGDSYLGRWCNLGADTNTSNLKNDYGEVSAYAPDEDAFVSTGRQFAGLVMGDHSKCGINTMFNTGTVVGTFCNLFGGGFPPRYVPPFSWGGPDTGFAAYRLQKALSVAERVMSRRNTPLTDADSTLLSTLFERTEAERADHHDG